MVQSPQNRTYLPDFTAVLITLSAWLNPSAEPISITGTIQHQRLQITFYGSWEQQILMILPIAIEVICVFCSVARSSTWPLAS